MVVLSGRTATSFRLCGDSDDVEAAAEGLQRYLRLSGYTNVKVTFREDRQGFEYTAFHASCAFSQLYNDKEVIKGLFRLKIKGEEVMSAAYIRNTKGDVRQIVERLAPQDEADEVSDDTLQPFVAQWRGAQ